MGKKHEINIGKLIKKNRKVDGDKLGKSLSVIVELRRSGLVDNGYNLRRPFSRKPSKSTRGANDPRAVKLRPTKARVQSFDG